MITFLVLTYFWWWCCSFSSCFQSFQSLSRVWLFVTSWTTAHQASLSMINSQSPHKPMSIESVMLSNHLVLCHHFSSSPQSFPASGSFPVSCLFASGDQCIEASASASVLPMNIQGWFPLGLTGLISLLSKGLSRVFSNITVQKHRILWHSAFFMVQLSHPYMTIGKNHSFDYTDICRQGNVSAFKCAI